MLKLRHQAGMLAKKRELEIKQLELQQKEAELRVKEAQMQEQMKAKQERMRRNELNNHRGKGSFMEPTASFANATGQSRTEVRRARAEQARGQHHQLPDARGKRGSGERGRSNAYDEQESRAESSPRADEGRHESQHLDELESIEEPEYEKVSNSVHTLGKKKYKSEGTKLTYKNLERYDEFQLTEEEKAELLRRRKMKQLSRAIDSEHNSPVDGGKRGLGHAHAHDGGKSTANDTADSSRIDVNHELSNADDPRFALPDDVGRLKLQQLEQVEQEQSVKKSKKQLEREEKERRIAEAQMGTLKAAKTGAGKTRVYTKARSDYGLRKDDSPGDTPEDEAKRNAD